MELNQKKVEKYKAIAKRHGLDLSEADIDYLKAFIMGMQRQAIEDYKNRVWKKDPKKAKKKE